jgi:DNA-binding MarR family transcriptional regulator
LKRFDITQAQYNVLRILQGAGSDGLGRNEISQRMVAITPDMTRLLDRLEVAGLVSRTKHSVDKRQTSTTITGAGKALLRRVEGPLVQHHKAQLRTMSPADTDALLTSMNAIRMQLRKVSESK